MSDDKIVKMVDKSDDAGHWSPEDALRSALEDIGKRGAFEKGKKLLVLALDDSDGQYSISFRQAGMRMSECTALCEIAKDLFKKEIGHMSNE